MKAHLITAILFLASIAEGHAIKGEKGNQKNASFDIVKADIKREKGFLEFTMIVSARAGAVRPTPVGKLVGAEVFSYVWPTSLDSSAVGFEDKQGVLALAVTSHPDFDDTPLFDENGDGRFDNDGNVWHSHWVVLVPDDTCGKGQLKVKDIPEGSKPKLPRTWPGLPLFIDSPGFQPVLSKNTVTVRVAIDGLDGLQDIKFDGVTAGLRVNSSVHSPLLCVINVKDIASGDLSLPGKAE
jgi:hypothetical protein